MKKILALATVMFMAGCEQAQQVKDGVKDAPVEFWAAIKEVLGFVFQLLVNVATGWFNGLFGS